jgi:phosphoglycolate phosphatase-like HAD superfamily hydrolase
MSFYVFDLDGTLADLTHRRHLVEGEVKDWDAFFAACSDDAPIEHALDLLANLQQWNQVEIWSGRSDAVRAETEAWLVEHAIDPKLLTKMRKAGDHRPDDVLKREFLEDAPRRPDIIFDDRKRVVDMWRSLGIPCFQVCEGDF